MTENDKSSSATDEAQLKQLFCRMGASPEQANVMVPQLLKRARQMADDKGIDYLAAVDYLVRLTVSARNGDANVAKPF